jgi:hypothetical protein
MGATKMAVEDRLHKFRLLRGEDRSFMKCAGDGGPAFHRRMDRREAEWRAGDVTAIAFAVEDCAWNQQPLPAWLSSAVVELAYLRMDDAEKRARREFWTHYTRWSEVAVLHERDNLSWEQCYAAVSNRLIGSFAAGSEGTVCASYKLMQCAGGEDATFESYKLALQRQRGRRNNK